MISLSEDRPMVTEFFKIWTLWMKTWLRKTLNSSIAIQHDLKEIEYCFNHRSGNLFELYTKRQYDRVRFLGFV